MKIKKSLIIFCVITLGLFMKVESFGQIGGENVYEFLTLPNSARITALGGHLVSVMDDDAALAFQNPAVLNASMSGQISFSHAFYLADVDYGQVSYAHRFGKFTHFAGFQYINYGNFQLADETGLITGEFSANELAALVGFGFQYSERLSLGATLKGVSSRFETYDSYGMMADVGLSYQDTSKRVGLSFVIKNLGGQLTTYREGDREKIPFDVQIGISKQLKYLPFRYTFTFHNLHRWNIRYDDPNSDAAQTLFGEGEVERSSYGEFADNFFQHVVISGEFLLGRKQNLRLRAAYNHQRRSELMVDNTLGLMGFSLGFGLKVNRFRIDYGRGFYHLAGNNNHLTISTNINEFR